MNERKPLRLKGYDYGAAGYYFVTVCTRDKQPLFWLPVTHNPSSSEGGVGADDIRPYEAAVDGYRLYETVYLQGCRLFPVAEILLRPHHPQ